MKENLQEKSLIEVNENSFFYKIKQFFKKLFHKNKADVAYNIEEPPIEASSGENRRSQFLEEIKKVEDEETVLLKLQKQYRNRQIIVKDLTEEQVNSLCKLYDKQIADLKKSNEARKQRLQEYRRKLQANN